MSWLNVYSIQVNTTHVLALISTLKVLWVLSSMSSWWQCQCHHETQSRTCLYMRTPWLPGWWHMTTHNTLACQWRQMPTLQTVSCNNLKTKKQPFKTFSQGKVHLNALFRHGRKYLWKKRLNIFLPQGWEGSYIFKKKSTWFP